MDLTASQTSTTLLRQVAGGNSPAAERLFYDRYSRMARAVILASGVRAQDSEDIAQEAMSAVMLTLRDGRYHREKGRFKSWFKGILRHKILHARRAAARADSPASSLPDRPDPSPGPAEAFDAAFEAEWLAIEKEKALDTIRGEVEPSTWQSYELTDRKGWRPKKVAEFLGMTRGAVDQANRRVRERLIELLAQQA